MVSNCSKLIYIIFPKKIIIKLLYLISPRDLWVDFVRELVINRLNILHTCRDGADDYHFITKKYVLSQEMSWLSLALSFFWIIVNSSINSIDDVQTWNYRNYETINIASVNTDVTTTSQRRCNWVLISWDINRCWDNVMKKNWLQ